MYIDTNSLPPNYSGNDAIEALRSQQMQKGGIVVSDPNKSFGMIAPPQCNGLWDQINIKNQHPYVNPYGAIEERLDKLELENKFLKLKILGMEGKFSQDEIKNIRAMLMSNDEAPITLANTIIETA